MNVRPKPISEDTIREVTDIIVDYARPKYVLLFGSYGRGDFDDGSDLDVLVVVPGDRGPMPSRLGLRERLRPLRVPIDLLIVTEDEARAWAAVPGSVIREAIREGRYLFDADVAA